MGLFTQEVLEPLDKAFPLSPDDYDQVEEIEAFNYDKGFKEALRRMACELHHWGWTPLTIGRHIQEVIRKRHEEVES